LETFGEIFHMNKKIAAIIAGSVAALGSAIVAAPVNAQTATLPVEITVKPAVFLRTYRDLKLVVSQQDLQGTGSVEQLTSYDETLAAGPQSLANTDPSITGGTGTVVKPIAQLYQVWGARTGTTVTVAASQPNLSSASAGGGLGGTTANTATMSISDGANPPLTNNSTSPTGQQYFTGGATLSFQFNNPASIRENTVFTGGQLRITVANP
jgi:hypothetical protein